MIASLMHIVPLAVFLGMVVAFKVLYDLFIGSREEINY